MRKAARIVMILCGMAATAACSGRYHGIDRASLPPPLAIVHDRAQAGDREAQYMMAVLFGVGLGVEQDCKTARSLLRAAAKSEGGRVWVYSPPVGNGTSGRVIPIDRGPKIPESSEAQKLLHDPDFCPTPAR